jgi:hypothetical protein
MSKTMNQQFRKLVDKWVAPIAHVRVLTSTPIGAAIPTGYVLECSCGAYLGKVRDKADARAAHALHTENID